MASRLTNQGYVKRTASEIKTDLMTALQEQYSSFIEQPADIQNMILDTSIQGIMEYENLMAEMINSYTPAFANQFMFLQMGATLGLNPRGKYKSQVLLQFKGKKGDYIPMGTKVSGFLTESSLTLGSTGEGYVNATSDDETIQEKNTLTNIQTSVPDGVTATNPSDSYKAIEAETFSQYKTRVQQLMRSARVGSSDYAISRIKALDGVDSRLVNFFIREYTETIDNKDVLVQGIEAVVGGGEPQEIANVLFNAFLETQKLISKPSDDDTTRTQTLDVNYLDLHTFSVSYTTPKHLSIGLTLVAKFRASPISTIGLTTMVLEGLTEYVNAKIVGTLLTHYELKNLIMDILSAQGYDLTNIEYIKFNPSVDGTDTQWDSSEKLAEIEFDCYITLDQFLVEIE